jgi:hypothetical protein
MLNRAGVSALGRRRESTSAETRRHEARAATCRRRVAKTPEANFLLTAAADFQRPHPNSSPCPGRHEGRYGSLDDVVAGLRAAPRARQCALLQRRSPSTPRSTTVGLFARATGLPSARSEALDLGAMSRQYALRRNSCCCTLELNIGPNGAARLRPPEFPRRRSTGARPRDARPTSRWAASSRRGARSTAMSDPSVRYDRIHSLGAP